MIFLVELDEIRLPCGAIGRWDTDGYGGYICEDCLTVYGSVSCPCNSIGQITDAILGPNHGAFDDEGR